MSNTNIDNAVMARLRAPFGCEYIVANDPRNNRWRIHDANDDAIASVASAEEGYARLIVQALNEHFSYGTLPKGALHRSPKPPTLTAIAAEVIRARTKFPNNAKLLAALVEEVGELAKALLQRKPVEQVNGEAIQVACVAVRIVEEGDSDFAHGNWGDAP